MTREDFPAFNRALAKLAVTLGKTLPTARIGAYFEALDDVSLPNVLAAIAIATKQAERFPTPGKLRHLAAAEAQKAPHAMPGLQPPPAVPDTYRGWLEAHGIEMPAGTVEDARMPSYYAEAKSCGRREACQTGECVEQVPVPYVAEMYSPPRLTARYRWCQHHAARCAQRAERRVQREQQGRERSA